VNAPCDFTAAHAGLAARVAKIAIALVGEPNRRLSSKRQLRFGRKGSLAVATAGPKIGSWYDHENGVGGDPIELVRYVHGCGFREALTIVVELIGGAYTVSVKGGRETPDGRSESRRNQQRGFAIWNEAISIKETPVVHYMANRGLDPPENIDGEVIRFHPQCPYGKVRHPCMVALMRDIHTNQPQAIYRTALTPAGMKVGRMALGPKTGAAVKLSPDEGVSMGLMNSTDEALPRVPPMNGRAA
jgi:putative DNA primase/helicase